MSCSSLQRIELPSGITSIEDWAFGNCTSLTKIELPSNLVSVERKLFHGCTNLTSIHIPASVKTIGSEVFSSCSDLTKLFFEGDAPALSSDSFVGLNGTKIYYREDKNWNSFDFSDYGGDVTWFSVRYFTDYIYDKSNELWYPIKDMEVLEEQLKVWIKGSVYEQTFEDWMEEYTYEEILNMPINLPIKAEDGEFYLLESASKVKDVMGCVLFADVAQDYIDYIEQITLSSLSSESKSERIDGYNTFLSKVKNFHYRYILFEGHWWEDRDIFNETLQGLLLARTAIALADDTEDSLDQPVSYKYVTDMYKAKVDAEGENPNYYDELKYYILSGGDTSYLSAEYTEPLKDYGMIIKDMKGAYKIAKKVTEDVIGGEGSYDTASDIISYGIDNLAYFAEKYDLPGSDVIKKTKKIWKYADATIKYFDAMTSFSLPGVAKSALFLGEEYIKQVKAVYEDYEEVDAAWYALMYYHLKQNNEHLLDSIMNADGSVGLRDGFSLEDFSDYAFGYDISNSDSIEKSIVTYYRSGGYLGYSYSVGSDFRNYLLATCNNMVSIKNLDCEEYTDILLQCILAELNFKNGEIGVSFDIDAYASDSSLGKVSGSGNYEAETVVTLVATPYENVTFAGWKDPMTGEIVCDSKEYLIAVYGDKTYVAEFVEGEVEVAKKPVISNQPQNAFYVAGENVEKLTVTSYATDGGEISIDWYVNSTDKNTGGSYVGSGSSIYPDTTVPGTYYYYAVITNIKTDMLGANEVKTTVIVNSQTAKVEIGNAVQVSIAVTQLPEQFEYCVGTELVTEGMVVTAYYSDGSEKPLTEYEVEYDFSKAGETIVKVSYLNYSDEFSVMVKEQQELKFSGASLSLSSDISVKYEVKEELFADGEYSNPYVVFQFNDKEIKVSEYTVKDGKYIFTFADIAPKQINDTIYATLYAELDEQEYSSETREYSVATYCYNMLAKCVGNESYTSFCTLLVDMLNYGAAAQTYFNYNTEKLVTEGLTDELAALGTQNTPILEDILVRDYVVTENASVAWKGAGLRLEEAVTIRFKIATESLDGLEMRIESESGGNWSIPSSKFVVTDGGYFVFFDSLKASKMSEPVYATVYKDDVAVSNTIRYSIESYACSMQDSTDEALRELLIAMMKYGNAANTYVNE